MLLDGEQFVYAPARYGHVNNNYATPLNILIFSAIMS